ncbi:hypothetical protein [Aquimarina algiphila]|uniref:hypothetical protein n=1 Tax=Aquimarina algiphila TaxID=2047982 RepID=UPI00232D19EE|nr:hypothetical protein [Aquimarina algiphila]
MGRSKIREKEHAQILYVNERLTKKEVASRVGVTQKTIGGWAEKGNWDNLRKSLLVTKENQLSMLYDQLEWLNTHIAIRKVIYDVPSSLLKPVMIEDENGDKIPKVPDIDTTQFPVKIGNVATVKEADTISKITASIKKLEDETSIADIVQVAREFIKYIQPLDFGVSKKVIKYFDMFINDKIS